MEWLNFIATEVHKQFGPLFYPTTPDATKEAQKAKLATRFDHVSKTLAKQPYLTGDAFTIADAYLFTVVNWSGNLGSILARWPALQQFQARVAARPGVQKAMRGGRPDQGFRDGEGERAGGVTASWSSQLDRLL
jgi:glutathione S-transferase